MKQLKHLLNKFLPHQNPEGKLVHFMAQMSGWVELPIPAISTTLQCSHCESSAHYVVFADPTKSDKKVWICANPVCLTLDQKNSFRNIKVAPQPQRAIVWALFAELNGIGDEYHDVLFENVNQSSGKIDYMRKFVQSPRGFIVMEGEKGTGKSYSAMAICELFTRTRTSAMFMTQRQMMTQWLETFKSDGCTHFIEKVTTKELLVIDDFGTCEISPGFMAFFMDLVNTRMQWKNRGTVLTTNLNDEKLSDYCGDALMDRLNTGQKFLFKGKTRREKTIL